MAQEVELLRQEMEAAVSRLQNQELQTGQDRILVETIHQTLNRPHDVTDDVTDKGGSQNGPTASEAAPQASETAPQRRNPPEELKQERKKSLMEKTLSGLGLKKKDPRRASGMKEITEEEEPLENKGRGRRLGSGMKRARSKGKKSSRNEFKVRV